MAVFSEGPKSPSNVPVFVLSTGVPDEPYEAPEPAEREYEDACEECGGRQFVQGTQSHYSNGFDCLTLYLRCENCGDYEVECV